MSSLFGMLSLATGAMQAEQGAMDATANNVSNVNTPGYSRLRPVLVESDPVVVGSITYGDGVTLQQIQSLRDPILQLRIGEETQQQGQLNAFVGQMQQAQVQFTTSSSDIGTELSNFFSSLQQLSADPGSSPVRQGILSAASNLANAFNSVAASLQRQQSGLNLNVTQDVQQVNTLTAQIGKLNSQISHLQGLNENASALEDQRDVLVGQLSNLIDVSQIQSDNGITLTTSSGAPLVVGSQNFSLSTQTGATGQQDIYDQGKDITSGINSGDLAGLIQARDQSIAGLLNNLDTLAAGLANALNSANQQGYDLNGKAGGDLFSAPTGSGSGYAATMSVAITDPSLIAASSDGSSGSNGNVANLTGVQNQQVAGGQTPVNYYSGIVATVGNYVSDGTTELTASHSILTQLQGQLNSVSGVSLDEEASNMVQFQNAYAAAAKVVTTINDMLYTAINMGTLTG